MIVRDKSGIVFASSAKAVILDPAADRWLNGAAKETQPSEQLADGDVASWGSDNLMPQQMMRDVENTGVLSAAVEIKARIAIGKGPTLARIVGRDKDGQEELEFVVHPLIEDWMEASNFLVDTFALAKDLLATGNPFDQLILSKDRSMITGFRRTDPVECRFSKANPATRRSEFVYMSSDWSEFSNCQSAATDPHMAKIPLLDKHMPLADLQQRTDNNFNYIMSLQYPLFGRKYYAIPQWYPVREWVKMAQGIPALKKAMVKNQMNINYIVEIHPKFWENYNAKYRSEDDAGKIKIQEDFYDAVEKSLVGGENAYKSLFSTMITSVNGGTPEPGIRITTIDDRLKEGKLLVDSQAANSEILFAMQMTPALIGADMPGGPYSGGAGSGSNIREGYLIQLLTLELERKLISRRFDIAKQYNGWDRSLVLRFPNQLLTTLNTGNKTAPIS